MSQVKRLLREGLSDAIGFLGGSIAAYWITQWLGLDIFDPGYHAGSLLGIAAIGLGGGLGLHVARRWRGPPPADSED